MEHLPFTWAEINDYCTKIDTKQGSRPQGTKNKAQYDYSEGLYVDQRWLNKQNKKPIFSFGFRLTYTSFEYNDLKLNMDSEGLTAKFVVKNTGDVTGIPVPMMLLTFPNSKGDYHKYIFKGFEKVELEPLESKNVKILADNHALF